MATKSIDAMSIAFQAKYKYKIAGQRDNIFSTLGPLLKQDFQLNVLKSQRLRLQSALATIDNSTKPDDQKLKERGEASVESLGAATRKLRQTVREKDADDHKGYARVANSLLRDLRDAAAEYVKGRATLADQDYSANDENFFRDLQTQLDTLKSIVSRQKVYLRQENVIFSTDINAALRSIKAIEATITNFSAPAVDGTTPPEEGSDAAPETESLDITV